MTSIHSLPPEQLGLLELLLYRGATYDEIAQLLSIERAAVRERALAAFDAIGPDTNLPRVRRALIADYLLGQLPERLSAETRARLAVSASERAWARVLSSELTPLGAGPLPDLLDEALPRPRPPDDQSEPEVTGDQPSSRFPRPMVSVAAVVVALTVAIVVITSSSSGTKAGGSSTPRARATTNPARTSTATVSAGTTASAGTTSSTSKVPVRVIAQIKLYTPISGRRASGIAEVLQQGVNRGIAIGAQNVPPNTTHPADAYAVWLYNSPSDAHILGFVSPGVTKTRRLTTAGGVPSNASRYRTLIITLETHANPKSPGKIILEGALTGL